ncbi:MAG: hypothetical protein ACRDQV_17165 [Pseudonocardiaceae bacterium]
MTNSFTVDSDCRCGIPVQKPSLTPTPGRYKNLARVERDFRSLKTADGDLRPIHHYLSDRVRAHVLICMLARVGQRPATRCR